METVSSFTMSITWREGGERGSEEMRRKGGKKEKGKTEVGTEGGERQVPITHAMIRANDEISGLKLMSLYNRNILFSKKKQLEVTHPHSKPRHQKPPINSPYTESTHTQRTIAVGITSIYPYCIYLIRDSEVLDHAASNEALGHPPELVPILFTGRRPHQPGES